MTTTPAVPTANSPRFAHTLVALAVVLGLGATSCDAKVGATKNDVPATITSASTPPQGYSYDHDSRINETP